jgi:hypothetical protein
MDKTVVIFRKDKPDKDGFHPNDVFALFPEEPSDLYGYECTCHQHIGGHGGADYYGCIHASRPASPEEYAELLAELEKIHDLAPDGYEIRKRATRAMHDKRHQAAKGE